MKIFKHQLWHLLILTALLCGLYFYSKSNFAFFEGSLWGISSLNWYGFAILSPIIHQIYVLLCWRSELHFKSISNLFGDFGFPLYKIGFAILIFSRMILIILLAISYRDTLNMNPAFAYILSGILFIPAAYLFYSVKRYFGIDRAFGLDHFKPEEVKKMPFPNQGIFKYTSNGMYIYGFLILYIPGLLLQSEAAIIIAFFNHLYIWVHYFFTEKPDMKEIYK